MRSLDWRQLDVKIIHGNICLWLVKKELSIFSAQRSTSFQILYCVFVRYTRTPPIERCTGTKIGMVQIISGKKKLWQNRLWADGIRVEYFPRIQYVAAQWRSQMFAVEIRWDTREVHRKNYTHDNVQWYFLWIKRQWKRMLFKCQSRCSFCKEIWKRTMDIHWSWFWEKVVLDQWRQSTRRMGPYGGKDVSGISREWLSHFPCYKSIVKRSTQKAKDMENCRYTMQPKWKRSRLFFAYLFLQNQLSLYGTVAEMCEEYETLRDRSGATRCSEENQVLHSCWAWSRQKCF